MREKLSAFSIFHATFLLYYMAVPGILFFLGIDAVEGAGKFTRHIFSSDLNDFIKSFGLISFSYFILVSTYIVKHKSKRSYDNKKKTRTMLDVERAKKIVFKYGMFFLIIGGVSTLLFFYQLGGFRAALKYADILRYAGTDSSQYYGPFAAMLRMLSFLVLGAPYCFKVYSDQNNDKNSKVFFLASFCLSMMYLVFNSGRATILFFLIPFVLDYAVKRNKNVILAIISIFVLVVITAEMFDILLYQLTTGSVAIKQTGTSIISNAIKTINDLSFPFSNTIYAHQMNELYGYRYGMDYFIWIFDIIPTRIFSFLGINLPQLETMNANTSAFHYLLDPTMYGGVPTDFITIGMRQFSIIGLALNSLLFSLSAIYIDNISEYVGKDYNLILIRIQLLFFSLIANNDLTDIIRGNLFLIIMIVMVTQIRYKTSKKLIK